MTDSTIQKLNFYRSYWETANTFDEADRRLKFIEAILNLGFANAETDFGTDTELARVFIQTKANVLADLKRKKGGAPTGNQNAKKNNPKTTRCFNVKTNNVDVDVDVNVKEKEKEDSCEQESSDFEKSQSLSVPIPSKRFIKPSVEEIREFCKEQNLQNVDAESFIDFYESKGCLVGKTKMKDWRASVRSWNRRNGDASKQENSVEIPEFFDPSKRKF